MIPYTLRFKLILEMSSEQKVGRVIDRLGRMLGVKFEIVTCEPYGDAPRRYLANIRCAIGEVSFGDAIIESLRVSNSIASRWTVGLPQCYEQERHEFSGAAPESQLRVPGIIYADFTLSNFR